MSWCPKCRVEYDDGRAMVCGDCGEILVDILPPVEELDVPAFLMTVTNDIQANIVKSLLEAYSVPVMKKYKGAGGYTMVFCGNTCFGVDIYVPSKLLSQARDIVGADFEMPAEAYIDRDDFVDFQED